MCKNKEWATASYKGLRKGYTVTLVLPKVDTKTTKSFVSGPKKLPRYFSRLYSSWRYPSQLILSPALCRIAAISPLRVSLVSGLFIVIIRQLMERPCVTRHTDVDKHRKRNVSIQAPFLEGRRFYCNILILYFSSRDLNIYIQLYGRQSHMEGQKSQILSFYKMWHFLNSASVCTFVCKNNKMDCLHLFFFQIVFTCSLTLKFVLVN